MNAESPRLSVFDVQRDIDVGDGADVEFLHVEVREADHEASPLAFQVEQDVPFTTATVLDQVREPLLDGELHRHAVFVADPRPSEETIHEIENLRKAGRGPG